MGLEEEIGLVQSKIRRIRSFQLNGIGFSLNYEIIRIDLQDRHHDTCGKTLCGFFINSFLILEDGCWSGEV